MLEKDGLMKKVVDCLHIDPHSNTHMIIRAYIRTLLVTTFLSVLITASVVAFLLGKNVEVEADKMIQSLQSTFVHQTPNTDAWEASSRQGPSLTYVKIDTFYSNRKVSSTFYSSGTRNFLKNNEIKTLSHSAIHVVKNSGLFYYRSKITKRAYYQVWLSMDYIIRVIYFTLGSILLVSLLSLIIGIILISFVSRRITRPLAELTAAAAQQSENDANQIHPTLPTPLFPTEVNQLAISFNQLLSSLNDKLMHEYQFVSDASHELRTPLSVIRGYISLLKRRGRDHPEIIAMSLEFLDKESLRLQNLIEDLLKIARNDQLQLEVIPIDLSSLVAAVGFHYRKYLKQNLIVICPDHVKALADSDSLEQIILALLDNAGKYSPADSTITLKVHVSSESVNLSVSDEGVGISSENKKHVFERFYRADKSRSSEIPGTGLGLAIVQQLVQLNQAQADIKDNQPHGTIFTIKLKK